MPFASKARARAASPPAVHVAAITIDAVAAAAAAAAAVTLSAPIVAGTTADSSMPKSDHDNRPTAAREISRR